MDCKLSYEFDVAGICRLSVHAGVKNIGIYLRPFSSPLDRCRYRIEILNTKKQWNSPLLFFNLLIFSYLPTFNLLVFLLVEEELNLILSIYRDVF